MIPPAGPHLGLPRCGHLVGTRLHAAPVPAAAAVPCVSVTDRRWSAAGGVHMFACHAAGKSDARNHALQGLLLHPCTCLTVSTPLLWSQGHGGVMKVEDLYVFA